MHGTAFFSSLLVPPPTSQGYYFNLGHRAVVRLAGSWDRRPTAFTVSLYRL
jgi:hypothetical protein